MPAKPCVEKQRAIAEGKKTYFTGKPCKYGHVDQRGTINSICRECSRIASRNSYNKKKEDPIEWEKEKQRAREYYHKYK